MSDNPKPLPETTPDGWTPINDDPPMGDWIVAYRDGAAPMFAVGYFGQGVWRLTDWGNEIPNPEAIHPIPKRLL